MDFLQSIRPPPRKPDLTPALERIRSGSYAAVIGYLKTADYGATLAQIREHAKVGDQVAFCAIQDLVLARYARVAVVDGDEINRRVLLTPTGRKYA